jgi:hypothetical protein
MTATIRSGPGRPRKYGRPSRAVTLTLPEDVLDRLAAVDADLGRAIVALVDRKGPAHATPLGPAEIASYGNHAVIVVAPIRALRRIRGVQLVPVGNGRALISLQAGYPVSQLELDLRDSLDGPVNGEERKALEAIAGILRRARGARGVTLDQRTIIVLEAKRRRPA